MANKISPRMKTNPTPRMQRHSTVSRNNRVQRLTPLHHNNKALNMTVQAPNLYKNLQNYNDPLPENNHPLQKRRKTMQAASMERGPQPTSMESMKK